MITDDKGNKLSQPRLSKKEKSAAKRERMKLAAKNESKPKYCPKCGMRKRSKKHGVEFCKPEEK